MTLGLKGPQLPSHYCVIDRAHVRKAGKLEYLCLLPLGLHVSNRALHTNTHTHHPTPTPSTPA